MDSGKVCPSGRDKGKGKVPYEGDSKKTGKRREKSVGKRREKASKAPQWKGVDGNKWVPGDPMPESPTRSQVIAHNEAMVDIYISTYNRDHARELRDDPAYQELHRNFKVVSLEEGVPEGAETKTVLNDDLEYLFESSSDSSECSSDESESEGKSSISDS